MLRAIFYDTETTGIKVDMERIVEIAAYDPVNDKTFEAFVNPGIPIPSGAAAVHGISDEMVADAPDFSVVGQAFIEFCAGDTVLIAHNNESFDRQILFHECQRHKLDLPEFKYFDTLKWARKYRKDIPRHTLQILREIYGIKANNAHRALDDVKVLYQIYQAMVDDLPIEMVCSLMEHEAPCVRMPFGKHQGKSLEELPSSYVKWMNENGVFDKPENATLRLGLEKVGLLSPVAIA